MDMIPKAPHCNTCNLDFKSNKCFKQHIKTDRHIERSSKNYTPINILKCICERSFSYRQSLFVHHKTCEMYQKCKMTGVCCKFVPPIPTVETPMEAMQRKLDIYEKERAVQNARIETMQQQIDVQNKEQKKIKDKIAIIEHHHTSTQHQKSRDKRKKINKDVRQQILMKQENACGECKNALTPYFEIDHIIGLQFGGTDDESNLMALCRECHARKSTKENQCREQIKDAIKTIVRETLGIDQRVS